MPGADLRPMTIGEVLDRMFRLYKDKFWLFAGIMSLPFLVLFFLNTAIALWTRTRTAAITASTGAPAQLPSAATFLVGFGAILVILVITFIVSGIGQAATIFAVSDLYLGRTATIRSSFRQIRGHILQALGTIFLVGLIVGGGFILIFILGAILIPAFGRIFGLLAFAAFMLLGIPVIIVLFCRMGVAVPAAMLEDVWAGTAISRSMKLTKGFAMQIFLIFLLAWALAVGASVLLTMPFTIMALVPHPHALPIGLVMLQQVFQFIAQVIVAPVGAVAICLMYYNLRVRKEAFDLEHLMTSLEPGSPTGGAAPGAVLPA